MLLQQDEVPVERLYRGDSGWFWKRLVSFCRYLALNRCNAQLPELGLDLPLVGVQGDSKITVEVTSPLQTPIRLIYGVYQI